AAGEKTFVTLVERSGDGWSLAPSVIANAAAVAASRASTNAAERARAKACSIVRPRTTRTGLTRRFGIALRGRPRRPPLDTRCPDAGRAPRLWSILACRTPG